MATVLAAALLTLAGCASDEDPGPSEPSAQSSASPAPAGGTPDQPAPIEATTSLMEWVPAPGAVANTVTTNGTWFLTVEASGDAYRLDGPDQAFGTGEDGTRITNALLDTDWAVVVRQDEGRKKPATAEITDLAKGEQLTIDEDSDVPTISGGTWALGGDTLAYATPGPEGGYCVATRDLATGETSIAWCAEAKHGFNAAHVTDGGTAVLGFDDSKPSCRTVGTVGDDQFDPFAGVPECAAWEGAALGDDCGDLVGHPERGRHRHGRVLRPRGRRATTTSGPARRARSCRARTRRTSSAIRSGRATRPGWCAGTAAAWRSSTRRRPASRSSRPHAVATPRWSSPRSPRAATSR